MGGSSISQSIKQSTGVSIMLLIVLSLVSIVGLGVLDSVLDGVEGSNFDEREKDCE